MALVFSYKYDLLFTQKLLPHMLYSKYFKNYQAIVKHYDFENM